MDSFLENWHTAAKTSLGLFWMAFWAFGLGYLISSMIQVFVTRERMQKAMGERGPRSMALGTLFGFISSSCSFAALSTTRSLFTKGAGLAPALAFLLASTNLVIELGIVIAVFLGWQFVVGEYAGAVLLIGLMWLVVRLTLPKALAERARDHAREVESAESEHEEEGDDGEKPSIKQQLTDSGKWKQVASRYTMEWSMVWKDVAVGFAVAGVIAAFVPRSFFEAMFIGSGTDDPTFWQIIEQSVVGPVAAFFTFIGSMGNIPLAAVLFGNGVSFAGVMAFIFSDLVVLPVLRIQAKYYGWTAALYILAVFLVILVASALILHYSFAALGMLPDHANAKQVTDRTFFAIDYTFLLNLVFLAMSAGFVAWKHAGSNHGMSHGQASWTDRLLLGFAMLAFAWVGGGMVAGFWVG